MSTRATPAEPMEKLLAHLLGSPPVSMHAPTLESWRQGFAAMGPSWPVPVDRAFAGGFAADRLGYAFAGGYHAATLRLLPFVPPDLAVSFCVTEEGGGHPRAIRTSLVADGRGGWLLSGKKRFATLAVLASELLVIASTGTDPTSGQSSLRAVRVGRDRPGVRVTPMPELPFAPEIPHAEVELAAVAIASGEVLEGDGYLDYVKPFRTIEDLHVQAALLGHLIGVARRHGFPTPFIERLAVSVVATRALALADPDAPAVHVAVAGLLEQTRQAIESCGEAWSSVPDEERRRWERDRALLEVASRARAARRERAWEKLAGAARG